MMVTANSFKGHIITLTEEEAAWNCKDALEHERRAHRDNLNNDADYARGKNFDWSLAKREIAYCSEWSAVKWFGIKNWKRDPNGFGKSDVGGFSVRCGTEIGYGLACHFKRDVKKQFPYLLVEKRERLIYRIVGMLPFVLAKQLREEGIGKPLPGSTDCWVIPQECMVKFVSPPIFEEHQYVTTYKEKPIQKSLFF